MASHVPVPHQQRRDTMAVLGRVLISPAFLASYVACAVYLFTLAPTVFTLDSAELTLAAYTLGLAHSPGYPTYLLSLHMFQQLPIGDVGYRSNLFSALANSFSVGALTFICQQLCSRWEPAVIAALCFAFSVSVWSVSVDAEVYTFQGAILAAVLLLLERWRRLGQPVAFIGAVGVFCLGVANSSATMLLAPGVAWIALITPQRHVLRRRHVLALVGVSILALSPILYLPIRSLSHPEFVSVGFYDAQAIFHPLDLASFASLRDYMSGRQFEGLFFANLTSEPGLHVLTFLSNLTIAFFGIGLPLGVWGFWSLWRRDRILTVGLALTAIPHAIFFITYGAFDTSLMFLPVYLVWTVFLGMGIFMLFREFSVTSARLIALLPLMMLFVNAPIASLRTVTDPADLARQRLREAAPYALYLATWGDADIMRYYQIVDGMRVDVQVVNRFFVPEDQLVPLVVTAIQRKRPVYVTSQELVLPDGYRAVSTGNGYRIMPQVGNKELGRRIPE
jgi:Protein of unknown function (DUF2723)